MAQIFDVVVIGGGPGGVAAAQTLARGGKKVAIIERAHMGGICLNWGCIPTKFFLAATAPLGALHDHARFGSVTGELTVDFPALQKRKDRFIKGSVSALIKSLQSSGIAIIEGEATMIAPGTVAVTGMEKTITATDIVIATGSRSASFSGLAPDGKAVLDSSMLLALENVPKSLLVVGAGAIGIEFADFFTALGAEVTIIEGLPTLVPTEDTDIGEELRKILQKTRKCITGEKVSSLVTKDGQAELTLASGDVLRAEKALIAVGRKPNTETLGIEKAGGSLTHRGFVSVDARLRTADNCYAVGDCNGLTLLAHAAEHQGEWVARHILGLTETDYASGPLPSCVFGHIEVMRAGKTAREALGSGNAVFISKAPFTVNPIAQAHAATAGFAKAVWEEETLVGMAAVGHGASHLITAAQLLVLHKLTPNDMHDFMFAHPSLDEVLKSALNAPHEPMRAE